MQLIKTLHDGLPAVSSMSDNDLLAELAASLDVTARHLLRLSAVWRELESRGHDLTKLRSGLREWLPMIAAEKLAAEAVVQFAGQTQLLRAIAELPLERQRALAKGEEITVVTFGLSGGLASERVPAHRLTRADVELVFDKGHIRTSDEQVPLLHDRARRRNRTTPETIRVRVSPSEYQELARLAKSKRMLVSTLVVASLRESGVLSR